MVSKNKEMDNREIEKILASAEQLRLREKEPEPWTDNYSDMNSMEKSSPTGRADGKSCQLSEELLEADLQLPEGRKIQH